MEDAPGANESGSKVRHSKEPKVGRSSPGAVDPLPPRSSPGIRWRALRSQPVFPYMHHGGEFRDFRVQTDSGVIRSRLRVAGLESERAVLAEGWALGLSTMPSSIAQTDRDGRPAPGTVVFHTGTTVKSRRGPRVFGNPVFFHLLFTENLPKLRE